VEALCIPMRIALSCLVSIVIVIPWPCLRRVEHPWASTISGWIIQASVGPGLFRGASPHTGLDHFRRLHSQVKPQRLVPTGILYLTPGALPPRRLPRMFASLGPGPLHFFSWSSASRTSILCLAHQGFGNTFSVSAGIRP
jgi:hypothetical protein